MYVNIIYYVCNKMYVYLYILKKRNQTIFLTALQYNFLH